MSDVNTSLPVRTEAAGDVIVKIADGTTPAQQASVDISGNLAVIVKNTAASPVPIQGGNSTAVSTQDAADGPVAPGAAASKSIMIGGQFNTALPTVANGQQVALQVDASGRQLVAQPTAAALQCTAAQGGTWNITNVSGVVSLPTGASTAAKQDTGNTSLANIDGKLPATLGQKTMANSLAVVLASDQSSIPVKNQDGAGNALTSGAQGAARALDVELFHSGAVTSISNPIPVVMSNNVPGTEILDFKKATAVAVGASDTHTYTVSVGKTMTLQQISASSSGKIKVEIQIGAVTKVVKFGNTTYQNVEHAFQAPSSLAAATTVSVIVTNLDKLAMDVYSTIEGVES